MTDKFSFNTVPFTAKLKEQLEKNLYTAGAYLAGEIKESMPTGNEHGTEPSMPGETPHVGKGRLKGSISHEVNKAELSCRVGSNVKYSKFLELGTSRMSPRPFLRPAYEKNREALAKLLSEKMK